MLEKNSIYAFLTALFFATLGIFAKYIYKFEQMNPDITFFYSLFFSTVILFAILLFKHKNFSVLKKVNKKQLTFIILNTACVGLFLSNFLVLQSLQYINPGIQKVLVYSNPIFIIVLNYVFWKIKLKKNDIVSIVIMLIGLYLIIGEVEKSHNIMLGIIYSILAGFFIALYSVIEENVVTDRAETLVSWFYSFLFATIYCFVHMSFYGEINMLISVFSSGTLISLLFMTALCSFVVPYLCFLKSIETIGATKTGIISSTSPVIALIFSGILFQERLSILQGFGVICIIISSLLSAKK